MGGILLNLTKFGGFEIFVKKKNGTMQKKKLFKKLELYTKKTNDKMKKLER